MACCERIEGGGVCRGDTPGRGYMSRSSCGIDLEPLEEGIHTVLQTTEHLKRQSARKTEIIHWSEKVSKLDSQDHSCNSNPPEVCAELQTLLRLDLHTPNTPRANELPIPPLTSSYRELRKLAPPPRARNHPYKIASKSADTSHPRNAGNSFLMDIETAVRTRRISQHENPRYRCLSREL
ncbi:hypothetical protein E1B28_011745 [Marasmius oreades]|uniref:Uncharacterized protein n=1 Tax=Marasmius oreades TaxID=181124 RepID=A0A9P7UPX3_9AGAR|nr:uncharacterized protein E1B28_011745 [Marasmius oreades]KAG7090137.1 hypothetical protein E1B28_011745 [Marasmius oreades]